MITADSPIQSMGMIAGRLMMKKILVCLIVILLIGLLLVGAADARTSSGSGTLDKIESGDLVFVGEKNLNVSEIAFGEYSQWFYTREPGDIQYTIKISNGKIDVEEKSGVTYPLTYYPYNVSNNEYDMTNSIIVTDLESVLDGIYLNKIVTNKETNVETNKEIKADGADVINTETVQYYVKVKTAYKNEFDKLRTDLSSLSKWYDFNYRSDSAEYDWNYVIDISDNVSPD